MASRIELDPKLFPGYMQRTDDLQKAIVAPATTANYVRWQWSDDDSKYWSKRREESDDLFSTTGEKMQTSTEDRIAMEIIIEKVCQYDHNKITGNRLLDKVGIFGLLNECIIFRVKSAIPPVINPSEISTEKTTGIKMPQIGIKLIKEGEHLLWYRDSDQAKSHKLPPGVKSMLFYRFIGTAMPTSIKQYEMFGTGKRGRIISSFSKQDLNPNIKLWAWYIGRYLFTNGELGEPSAVLKVGVLLSDQINPFPTPTPVTTVTPTTPTTT